MLKSMIVAIMVAAGLTCAATPAAAEVVARTADGFTLHYAVRLESTAGDVILAVEDIGGWWDSAHTYSGDAANMTLQLQPGGCFCEALPNGETFEHGRVTLIDDEHIVLAAPLGPLNGHATRADLTFRWPEAGAGVTATLTFVVEGPQLGAAADGVDGVMRAQFSRFVHYVEYGEPPAPAE